MTLLLVGSDNALKRRKKNPRHAARVNKQSGEAN
jgi:hypothetical protein